MQFLKFSVTYTAGVSIVNDKSSLIPSFDFASIMMLLYRPYFISLRSVFASLVAARYNVNDVSDQIPFNALQQKIEYAGGELER